MSLTHLIALLGCGEPTLATSTSTAARWVI